MGEIKNKISQFQEYLKNNRNNVYIIGAIILLLLLITGMIALTASLGNRNSSGPSNANPSQTVSQISPSPSSIQPTLDGPIMTPNPSEAATIETQSNPQITPNIAVSYTVPGIILYGNTWAVMTIANPTTDNAQVILQKVAGAWKVVAGPGTYFSQNDLQNLGAPQELIDSFNSSPSVSPSLSPSPNSNDIQ